jgi:hypothetical protein
VGAPYRCVRTKQTPLRAPPCFNFFQSSEDGVESPSKEPWDILHDDDFGSNLINDSEEVFSEPSLVGFAFASAGRTEWLARGTRSDAMNDSTPRSAIEGLKIVGHNSWIQGRVCHTRAEYGRRETFALNVTYGA